MIPIINSYRINERTMILIPVYHADYQTMVKETDRTLYVRKTPLDIIESGCLNGFSTYEGRRKAIMVLTGYQRKVPIPILPSKHIFAFPTLSPENYDCHWLFPIHIETFDHVRKTKKVGKSKAVFKNGEEVFLQESVEVLEKQMQRTAYCALRMVGETFV